MPRYIVVWRRSATARYLDVQLSGEGSEQIAVFSEDETNGTRLPLIADEEELVKYVQGSDTETRRVDAELAHRVLGWSIPA